MRKIQTATTASVREINRSILLNLIRLEQPISRADLSRRTGMFRSNVSTIIDELVAEGMLTEERPLRTTRGRMPTHLRLNNAAFPVLGIYVQPGVTRVAFAGLTGALKKTWSFPTPQRPSLFIDEISRRIGKIQQEVGVDRFRRIGLALPGFVNAESGQITWSHALPEFSGYSLTIELERRLETPVIADNDSNLGALSELRLSEDFQHKLPMNFVFLSIGDAGVGAGAVLNGELYRGHDSGFAVEFGHMVIDRDGAPCNCGRNGCWEKYVSNEATWKRYKPREDFDRQRFIELVQAARLRESKAINVLRETAAYISLGVSNIMFALNPAAIVLAGEITEAWDVIQEPMERTFASPYTRSVLRRARLEGELPLLHGAVCLALSSVFARPTFGQ